MRLKKVFPAVFVLTVALHISLAVAMDGNPERGKNLATGCVCHRGDLDGMSAEKLAGRLMDFKSGRKKTRNHEQGCRQTD